MGLDKRLKHTFQILTTQTQMIEINQILITTWVMQIISNMIAGAGIAIGIYFAFKRLLPAWILQISKTLREQHAIERARQGRKI